MDFFRNSKYRMLFLHSLILPETRDAQAFSVRVVLYTAIKINKKQLFIELLQLLAAIFSFSIINHAFIRIHRQFTMRVRKHQKYLLPTMKILMLSVAIWHRAHDLRWFRQWASYQIRKIAGCACAGKVFPRRQLQRKPIASDPGMHHGTCVTHVPWCMSWSLTRGGREIVPDIPGACAPANLRIWQELHDLYGTKPLFIYCHLEPNKKTLMKLW